MGIVFGHDPQPSARLTSDHEVLNSLAELLKRAELMDSVYQVHDQHRRSKQVSMAARSAVSPISKSWMALAD